MKKVSDNAIFDYLKQQIRRSSQQLYTVTDPPVKQAIVDNINKLWAEINHISATKNQGNQLLRPPLQQQYKHHKVPDFSAFI